MVQTKITDGRQGFSQRLRQAMTDAGYPEWGGSVRLSRELQPRISERAVSKWLRAESMPDTKRLEQLASLLGVSVEWLLTGRVAANGSATPAPTVGTKVPVINLATLIGESVWQGFAPAKMAADWMDCPVEHGPHTFAFKVTDTANANPGGLRSYPPGCFLYVDPDQTMPGNERGVLARLPAGELVVAIYKLQAGHPPRLGYLNPGYRDYDGPFEIVGTIIAKTEAYP